VARRALADDFPPDTISTDLHRYSIGGPAIDLPTTMTKLSHLGMSRDEVLRAVTATPAAAVGRGELGTLRVGGPADVTVLRTGGEVELVDSMGARETAASSWVPTHVLVGGELHEPRAIDVRLREYTDADREVDCTAPLT
jgi:dihydroorotase